jgi:hypothetical protein
MIDSGNCAGCKWFRPLSDPNGLTDRQGFAVDERYGVCTFGKIFEIRNIGSVCRYWDKKDGE